MKKELAKYLAIAQGLDLSYHPGPTPIDNPDGVQKNDLDNMLAEIFAPDPLTGAPKGDIAYYLSPDGNPMIKQWLENNLLAPRGVKSSNGQYDDDTIAEYSRGADESVDAYRERIIGYIDENRAIIEEANKSK